MDLTGIFKDYEANLLEDDEWLYNLKEVIFSLPESEKIIILLYADLQSMRKVARKLHVSTATAYLAIDRIRNKVIEKLYDIYKPLDNK